MAVVILLTNDSTNSGNHTDGNTRRPYNGDHSDSNVNVVVTHDSKSCNTDNNGNNAGDADHTQVSYVLLYN